MKVWIPNSLINPKDLRGKSLFCNRLGKALVGMGVNVTNDPLEPVDISLDVIRLTHKNSKVKVLRLNGVYHNTGQDYDKKNANIKKSLEACDAVVYQSHHSKLLCDAFIGKPRDDQAYTIVYNGADPMDWKYIKPNTDYAHKKIVLTFAKWRPHKRLRETIDAFLLADVEDSVLLIAGDITHSGLTELDLIKLSPIHSIIFLGDLSQQELATYIKAADVAVHLCWFDACPNSVVECLCAGLPVISNNVGGTHDLLRICGISELVCLVDTPYDYKPVDLYRPPAINLRIVSDKIERCLENPPVVDSGMLDIDMVAKQYLNFFEGLL